MNYSKYTSPHPVRTKKQRKKDEAEVHHACWACEGYHPRVRKAHKHILDLARKYPRIFWDDLLDFERQMDTMNKRCKAFDRRMATSRERRRWST